MAWLWWLLAPVASTGLGAVAIWWRTPTETGRRLRRPDPVSEHRALLRALAQQPSARVLLPATMHQLGAEHPVAD
jgi:hypothetical protein